MAVWIVLFAGWGASAGGPLAAGDIAVVAFNTDEDDDFAWVALRAIPANTRVCFTDSSVSNGFFRWSEHLGDAVLPGPLTWTHTHDLPAGTVVAWRGRTVREWSVGTYSGGWPSLSVDGDQLFVYTGTVSTQEGEVTTWRGLALDATMIYGLNFANGGWDNVTGGGTTTSFVPPGLSTSQWTAVHVDSRDSGFYAGIRTGTAVRLLRAISVSTNWSTSNDPLASTQWPGLFTVLQEKKGTQLSLR